MYEYGLGAFVHTNDISRALRVASKIQSDTVSITTTENMSPQMPFGGSKKSGLGRENARCALMAYTEPKSIFIRYLAISLSYKQHSSIRAIIIPTTDFRILGEME
ncbi:hypothetical protein J3F84DRAFT_390828 [Trichoderma pleuroticola]